MTQKILLAELKRFETYIKQFKQLAVEPVELYRFFESQGNFELLEEEEQFQILKCAAIMKRMCDIDDKLIENFSYLKTNILKKLPANT